MSLRLLVLLALVMGGALGGIYPSWFKQYKGRLNVTLCWTTYDGWEGPFDCPEYAPKDVEHHLYHGPGGEWTLRYADMYTRCPGFADRECHDDHPLD